MKTAAVLLSFLVIFLNAVPCCWDSCDEQISIEETSESDDSCSPFLSCGNCAGFVQNQFSPELPYFSGIYKPLNEQKEVKFQSDLSFEIWQPPKKV